MSDSPISLEEAAAADLRAPSIGAVVRWTRRAAKAKGILHVAEMSLRHWHDRARDVHVSALALSNESLQAHVESQVPTRELMLAEEAYAAAVEAHDFAERVCALLPQRLKDAAKNNGQASAKPQLAVQQGGRK